MQVYVRGWSAWAIVSAAKLRQKVQIKLAISTTVCWPACYWPLDARPPAGQPLAHTHTHMPTHAHIHTQTQTGTHTHIHRHTHTTKENKTKTTATKPPLPSSHSIPTSLVWFEGKAGSVPRVSSWGRRLTTRPPRQSTAMNMPLTPV